MEAQQKLCRSDEFSDRRLEQFLRCEGMNAKVRCFENDSGLSEVLCASIGNSRVFLSFSYTCKQLGALRFSNYWHARRDVFGEKYLLPMTLSRALEDDIAALESGVFCLLPRQDVSGRQILYLDPSRRKRGDYTSDSLVGTEASSLLCELPAHITHSHSQSRHACCHGTAPCHLVCYRNSSAREHGLKRACSAGCTIQGYEYFRL